MNRNDIGEILQTYDLSVNSEFEIHGPWGWRGLEAPVHIFQKGTGEKVKVGKAIAKIVGGLKFEIILDEEYKNLDVDGVSFEVPMHFLAKRRAIVEGE